MIWLDGQITAPDHLTLPLADRIFEHGLGLFETFRTWGGTAPLLDRHIARIHQSACALGIILPVDKLPTLDDVARLLEAAGYAEALIRLTVSAGRGPELPATVWMNASPLLRRNFQQSWQLIDAPWTVACDDPLSRHKTLNYWSKRIATVQANDAGADEAVFHSADGRIWEGSRSNLFLIHEGTLITPPRTGPILPGIMRGLVLEVAGDADLAATEADVTASMVDGAAEIFVTNSVRGLVPGRQWLGRNYRPIDPGFPTTTRLQTLILEHLAPQGFQA